MEKIYALDYEYNTGLMSAVVYFTDDKKHADLVARKMSLNDDCYRIAVYELTKNGDDCSHKLVDQYSSGMELMEALKKLQPRSQSIDRDY